MTLAATLAIASVITGASGLNEAPACDASTASMAYSGSMAMRARTAIAREADTSDWATSAAHDSRKAPPTIPKPNNNAANGAGR